MISSSVRRTCWSASGPSTGSTWRRFDGGPAPIRATRGRDDVDDGATNAFLDDELVERAADLLERVRTEPRLDLGPLRLRPRPHPLHDLELLVGLGIVDLDLEHEAIELGFREVVG